METKIKVSVSTVSIDLGPSKGIKTWISLGNGAVFVHGTIDQLRAFVDAVDVDVAFAEARKVRIDAR